MSGTAGAVGGWQRVRSASGSTRRGASCRSARPTRPHRLVAGWVVALAPAQSDLAPWSRWVLPLVAAVSRYPARSVRDRVARFAMLAGAAALHRCGRVRALAEHPTWVLGLVVTALIIAAAAVAGAVALTGGYHSTRLSRLADLVESAAVVLVLPLAVVAAGGIEALRRLTSG